MEGCCAAVLHFLFLIYTHVAMNFDLFAILFPFASVYGPLLTIKSKKGAQESAS